MKSPENWQYLRSDVYIPIYFISTLDSEWGGISIRTYLVAALLEELEELGADLVAGPGLGRHVAPDRMRKEGALKNSARRKQLV